MPEIRPQFTYSPDNVLTVITGSGEQFLAGDENQDLLEAANKDWEQNVEQIANGQGVELDRIDDVVTFTINVPERFGGSFNVEGDPDISAFLSQLDRVLPYHPIDNIDRVVGLEFLDDQGSNGVVYQHFQRWLDSQSMDEAVARQAVVALAQPFGADVVANAEKDFFYIQTPSGVIAEGYSSKVVVRRGPFGVVLIEEGEDEFIQKSGTVEWCNLDINTLGSCACWGATADERRRIQIDGDSKRLYDLNSHNVDYARQALSHILGIGVLAFHAAKYEGNEDILAAASWGEPREYPKAF